MKIVKTQLGLTLIEILASLAILSIVVISFLSFFSQAMMFSSKAEDKVIAINIAERVLSDLKKSELLDPLRGYNHEGENIASYEINNKIYFIWYKVTGVDLGLKLIQIKIYIDHPDFNPGTSLITEIFGYQEERN